MYRVIGQQGLRGGRVVEGQEEEKEEKKSRRRRRR
jgi:hypothetical protein